MEPATHMRWYNATQDDAQHTQKRSKERDPYNAEQRAQHTSYCVASEAAGPHLAAMSRSEEPYVAKIIAFMGAFAASGEPMPL